MNGIQKVVGSNPICSRTEKTVWLTDHPRLCGFSFPDGGYSMKETIYLAGGCFWGCEKFFEQFDGILETECGYANGPTDHVT